MKNISRLTSGRVPVKSPVDVASDRYQLLDLGSAEPNLGTAANGTVLTTDSIGTRTWTDTLALQNLDVANDLTVNKVYTDNLFFANGNPYITATDTFTNIYNGKSTVTTASTLIDSVSITGNSTVKWTISSRDVINGRYKSSTVDSINNGTTAYYNEYGVILSNNNYEVATFTSNISGGNINLYATGDSANVAVTFQRVALGSSTSPGYLAAGSNGRDGYTGSAGSGSGGGGSGATGYTGSAGSFSGTTTQAIVTTNTTASTSKTTGALRVTGGAGIGGNLYVGGTTYLTGDLLPTANNTINIGSSSSRFGTLYLAANTIDLGGTTITTAATGELVFTTQAGNVSLSANTINFLSSIANTSTNQGDLSVTGNLSVDRLYVNSYFYANGSSFSGGVGYTGSRGTQGIQGTAGYTGSSGLGYTGSAGYTGSQGTQGSSCTTGYTGSAGSMGSAGYTGSTGSSGTTGYTGSAGSNGTTGYTGSAGTQGSSGTTGYTGSSGSSGTTGYTGSQGTAGSTGYTGSTGAGYTGSQGIQGATGNTGTAGATGYTGSRGADGASGSGYLNLLMPGSITAPVTGTARFYPPTNLTVNTVYANLSANPTNGNLTFIIKKNGTNTGTTFTLSSALMTAVSTTISLTTTDYLTVDVTGSAMAADLHIKLKYA